MKNAPKTNALHLLISVVTLISMVASSLAFPQPVLAANTQPVQVFFLSMPENQVLASFKKIYASSAAPMDSVTSISITTSNTFVYYDHWENGYEADLANPTNVWTSGNLGGTQIWGNGKEVDGCPPNIDGKTALTCSDANDVLTLGNVIVLDNNVPLPRTSAILYDGRDKVGGTKALAVTRSVWAATPGTVLADAVEVYDTSRWGTSYEMPVGQNTVASSMFTYASVLVVASQNATTVTINKTSPVTVTLNQGDAYQVDGGMNMGDTVVADKPVQVNLLTGKVGSTYASRWFSIPPTTGWTSSMWTAVGTTVATYPANVLVYNPNNSSALTVSYETKSGSGSFSVPANNIYRFEMPLLSGGHFYSSGAPFLAVGTMDSSVTGADQTYDWGYTLVPDGWLTTGFVTGWAPGNATYTGNGSPVWVTAIKATTIYVDYGAPAAAASAGTDPNGKKYDTSYALGKYESKQIYGVNNTQTGMKVWTADGTSITGAWGEDPKTAAAGTPYLDVGYTIPPLPEVVLTKQAALAAGGDVNSNGKIDPGDTIQYTLSVVNKGVVTAFNTTVKDSTPVHTTYVAGSTKVDGASIADLGSAPFFPLQTTGGITITAIAVGASASVTYQMKADLFSVSGSYTEIVNGVDAEANGEKLQIDLRTPINSSATSCVLAYTISDGTTAATYQQNDTIYLKLTDADTSGNGPLSVTMMDATSGDRETVSLAETGSGTGIFAASLPASASIGAVENGTLYTNPGDSLSVSYTDALFSDTCSSTASISVSAKTKQLYFNGPGQGMSRVDPVASGNTNTLLSGGTSATVTITANNDTYIDSNNTSSNYGSTTSLSIANSRRSILDFSLASILAGSTITKATLNVVKTSGSNTYPTGAYQVTDAWTESGATWSKRDASTNWTTSGGDFNATAVATTSVSSSNKTYQWNITSLVTGWFTTPASNYGVLLKRTGSGSKTHTFGSSENSASGNRPTLTVEYISTGVPGPSAAFVQTSGMASPLSLPAGGNVKVVAYMRVAAGTLPLSNPAVTAALEKGGSAFLTLSNPTVTLISGSEYKLEWTGTIASSTSLTTNQQLTTRITSTISGLTFNVLYGSSTYPSRVELPTTTVIKVESLTLYDAPDPDGVVLPNPANGQTVYIRAVVSDPFGPADISSATLNITDPASAVSTITLDDGNEIASTSTTKTYETAWSVPAAEGTYALQLTAKEGLENTVTDVRSMLSTIKFSDTGTPSVVEFTATSNGTVVDSYDSTASGTGQVCLRLTDYDKNVNTGVAETLTVTLKSTTGDTETVTLTETGVNTGVFVNCLDRVITSGANVVGSIYAAAGDLLTVSYTDATDPSDTSSASAILTTATPTLAVSKLLVEPANGIAVIGEQVRFDLIVANPSADDLNTVKVIDTFQSTCLTYASASTAPDSSSSTTLTWNDIGPLVSLSSRTISVYFAVSGVCSPTTNQMAVTAKDTNNGDAAVPASGSENASATVSTTRPRVKVTKTRTSSSPALVGSDVTFQIVLQNTGSTSITTLPLTDNYSAYCMEFKSSTPSTTGSGGTILWSNLGPLAAAASTTVSVTFTVQGACNPSTNTAVVGSAVDANGDAVALDPASSTSATVVTQSQPISAVNDTGKDVDGIIGGQALANVLANDTLNGLSPVLLADVNLTLVSVVDPSSVATTKVTLDLTDGSVDVAANTPFTATGTFYTLTYKICKKSSPATCSTATVNVPVNEVGAVDDGVVTIDGAAGGTAVANVLANDTVNGVTATPSTVDLTLVDSLPTGFTFNLATGAVTVASGTNTGLYTFKYKICKTGSATICSTATVSVQVGGVTPAMIGLGKELIGSPVKVSAGLFELTYKFWVRNYGAVALSSVQVTDNLNAIFASPTTYTVQSLTSTDFTVNGSFDGDSDQNLLSATGNTLPVSSAYKTITLVIRVIPASTGPFANTATASGKDPSSNTVTDISQDGSDPDQTSGGAPANNGDGNPTNNSGATSITFSASIFDPPFGIKTYDDTGLPVLRWTMIWINETNIPALGARVADPISEGTAYAGGLVCTPASLLTTTTTCAFEPASIAFPRGRIIWEGTLGPDQGHLDAATANNELDISFNVSVLAGTSEVNNTASVDADLNGDGSYDLGTEAGLASSHSTWPSDGSSSGGSGGSGKHNLSDASLLPMTGFAPDMLSRIPAQPDGAAYQTYSGLTLEIPELDVNMEIIGVPFLQGNWDTSWLGDRAGYLAGTAFPTWDGNSVITGHVYGFNGEPGPFVNLGSLHWGSRVIIHAYGQKFIYEVRLVRAIRPDNVSVLGHQDNSWVTLLTCKQYDEATGLYRLRTAVQAVLIRAEPDAGQ